jgi:hypothetical protein
MWIISRSSSFQNFSNLGRSRCRWKVNTNINLKIIVYVDVDRYNLALDGTGGGLLWTQKTNLWAPLYVENFLTSWGTTSFSRTILLYKLVSGQTVVHTGKRNSLMKFLLSATETWTCYANLNRLFQGLRCTVTDNSLMVSENRKRKIKSSSYLNFMKLEITSE